MRRWRNQHIINALVVAYIIRPYGRVTPEEAVRAGDRICVCSNKTIPMRDKWEMYFGCEDHGHLPCNKCKLMWREVHPDVYFRVY